MNAVEELCKETALPDAQQFLEVMGELNQLVAQGNRLVDKLDQVKVDNLQPAQNRLKEDQQALADREASNAGCGASGADA